MRNLYSKKTGLASLTGIDVTPNRLLVLVRLLNQLTMLIKKIFFLSAFVFATSCSTNSAPSTVVPPSESPSTTPTEEALTLTQDLLVSGDWGPLATLGAYIEFTDAGAYTASLIGEGDGPETGTYTIEGNNVLLTSEQGIAWNLSLGESKDNLYFTVYLASDGTPRYWDRSSSVAAGTDRTVDSYPVVIVNSKATLKSDATPKSKPSADAPVYTFKMCAEGCTNGEVESFVDSFTGVLARTGTKETYNGVQDYWYLVGVELGWYSAALTEESNTGTKINYAWVHGSELQ